jgi:hypothetical protein
LAVDGKSSTNVCVIPPELYLSIDGHKVTGARTIGEAGKSLSSRILDIAFRAKTKLAPANGIKKPPNAGPMIPEMLNCKPLKVAAEGNSAFETT